MSDIPEPNLAKRPLVSSLTFGRQRAAIIVVGVGLLISFASFLAVRLGENEKNEAEFERRAQSFANLAISRLQGQQEILFTLRSLFHYSGDVTRQEFSGAARDLISRHVGVQALEWVPRVPASQRSLLETTLQTEGFPSFQLTERASDNTVRPAAARAEHFPVVYLEPFAGNEAALGVDLSVGAIAAQLQEIAGSGQIAASGRLPLLNPHGSPSWGYVMELPVYRLPLTTDSTTERRAKLFGFVIGVYRITDLITSFFSAGDDSGLEVLFIDRSAASDRQLLHYHTTAAAPDRSAPPPTIEQMSTGLHLRVPVDHAGRKWELWFRPTASSLAASSNLHSWLTLALGLSLTSLTAFWVIGAQRRSAEIARQVALRTAELRDSQAALQQDIDHRQAAEQQFRESESRLQAILDNSPAAIFVKDPAGYYVLVNEPFEFLIGHPRDFIIGRRDRDLFPADQAKIFAASDRLVLDAGVPMEFKETVSGPDNSRISIVQKFPLRATTGQTYALCGIATDITARKRAEAELQESRRQLSSLLSQLPGAAFRCLLDEDITLLFGTEGLQQLTGYAPSEFLAGRVHFAQIVAPIDRDKTRGIATRAAQERRSFELETRITHRDGAEKWLFVRGRPVFTDDGTFRFVEGLAIDVTPLKTSEAEKLAFERQLLQTQKLESLGVLAGGIAHDFNNLLTAMLGNATLARLVLSSDSAANPHLERIEETARHAADLCQQLLAYAGKRTLVTRTTNLTTLVRSTATLLTVSIHKNTCLILQLAPDLPAVVADASQLQQIVMNLVINAADAIGEANGEITVSTFERQADSAFLRTAINRPELPDGRYVGLEVSDNGSGMTPATLARIFEPFFTTKFSGRGLGLAAVLGIVKSHGGALFVESVEAQGTTFRLLLPALEGTSAPISTPSPLPTTATQPAAAGGKILIVDDEEMVRHVAGTALKRRGFSPITAADGNEALRLYEQEPAGFLAVLLDLTMPGISGEETLVRLLKINPTQRVIVMSGYSEEDTMRRCAELGASEFMPKPFELETLLGKFTAGT